MKKLFCSVLFFAVGLVTAQEYPPYFNSHELRFNMGRFLATTAIEGSYEYYFTEDTSIGGTVFFNGDAFGSSGKFGFGPNLRAYFGYKPKSGVFVEAFGLYYLGQSDLENELKLRNYDYSTTALG